ncbi:hypothetical protein BKA56DRAFT_680403 [Ilyonectria sp. MPI-CAGE-AT-0026]|nr:hypothetical protein BKA56DRAFT_680403 [Ilyonectria sp. MPI-CAGE-AT-0026]
MSHRYSQFNEFYPYSAWNKPNEPGQMSEELLSQPFLDPAPSSPAGNAAQSKAPEWNSNGQRCLSEDSPNHPQGNNHIDHPQPQIQNEVLGPGVGGETINVGREVLEHVRKAAQFEEHVKQRLAKIEETLNLWEDRFEPGIVCMFCV